MDSDRVIVWMAGNRKFVVRAFLDTGAQICFITKKLAKHLAPIGNGHNYKYIKVGKKLAKIQTYGTVKGNLQSLWLTKKQLFSLSICQMSELDTGTKI